MRRFRRRTFLAACLAAAATVALAIPAAGAGGERPLPRIVGGEDTTIGEWPWQVAIACPDGSTFVCGGNGFKRQFCGGSLITSTLVITAAHCVYDEAGLLTGFPPPENFTVISGRTTLSTDAGAETPVAGLHYFTGDPGDPALSETGPSLYDPNPLTGDAAWDAVVLELAEAADPPAAAIQIAGPDETATWEPDRDAIVTGWGNRVEGSSASASDTLQETQLHMLEDEVCAEYRNGRYRFDAQTMACAGAPGSDRDACQGDSGGPLVVPVTPDGFRLVGDTSFGDGCGDGVPAVYGRLAGEPMRSAIAALAGPEVIGSGAGPRDIPDLPPNIVKKPPIPDPGPGPDPAPPVAKTCLVADLRGRTVPGARRALRRRDCRLGRVTRRHSRLVRRGRVLAQRPPEGTRRRTGFRVRLVVSSGRR